MCTQTLDTHWGGKARAGVGQQPASLFCFSVVWLRDLLLGRRMGLFLSSGPSLPCFALCHRGCHLWEHFLSFFTSQLPFRFDQWETLAGDWKAGGRNKPVYFLHPTPPLWLLCGGLNLYYSPDSYRIRLARLWALFSDLVSILSFSLDKKKKKAWKWERFLAVASPSFVCPISCIKFLLW